MIACCFAVLLLLRWHLWRRCVPRARAAAPVTFSETIAPIVYDNCVTCHRPGEAAPFSLISYEDVEEARQADREGHRVALHAARGTRRTATASSPTSAG